VSNFDGSRINIARLFRHAFQRFVFFACHSLLFAPKGVK
jgi:hypothetical protein